MAFWNGGLIINWMQSALQPAFLGRVLRNFETGFICTTTTLAFRERDEDHHQLLMIIINFWWKWIKWVKRTESIDGMYVKFLRQWIWRIWRHTAPMRSVEGRTFDLPKPQNPAHHYTSGVASSNMWVCGTFQSFDGFNSDRCHLIVMPVACICFEIQTVLEPQF